MKPLRGEVAWITGASRGIGRACAETLARAGAKVALSARKANELEAVAAAIREEGGEALAVPLDVGDRPAIEAAAERIADALGPISVVVNNAGLAKSAPFHQTSFEDLERLMAVNDVGPFWVIRAALPGMLERRHGRIVNIASTAGRTGHRYTAAYTASKHALVGLTRALAVEVAGRGITANAVCPGWTETDLLEEALENIGRTTGRPRDEAADALARMNPMRRLMKPEEIARAVLFLADPAAGGITGQLLGVDGGEVIA